MVIVEVFDNLTDNPIITITTCFMVAVVTVVLIFAMFGGW